MRPELERIKYIEEYLEGNLPEQEAREFEAVIESNPDLKKDVEFQKDLAHRLGHAALVSQIDASHQRFMAKKPFWYNLNTWLAVGAVGVATTAAILGYRYGRTEEGQMVADNDEQRATTLVLSETKAPGISGFMDAPTASNTRVPFLFIDTDSHDDPDNIDDTGESDNPSYPDNDRQDAGAIPPMLTNEPNPSLGGHHQYPGINFPETKAPVDKEKKRWFSKRETPFSIYTINADSGGYFWHPTGTWVYIPPKALQTEDGRTVSGEVNIKYREFRNQAEIAFSGHPMTFHGENESRFNSAGMFELRAYSYERGDLRVKPAKEIVVDFALVDTLDRLACYKLDKKKNEWWEVGKIAHSDLYYYGGVRFDMENFGRRKHTFLQKTYKLLTGWAWSESYRDEVWPTDGRGSFVDVETTKRKRNLVTVPAAPETDSSYAYVTDSNYRKYPTVARGIRLEDVGVYNCDQLYRPKEAISIRGKFLNDGKYPIENPLRLVVIDLGKNTAFTYRPKEKFQIHPGSAQALLIITDRNELYYMDAASLAEKSISGKKRITFMMEDISDRITTPQDLQRLLGIQQQSQ